MPANLTSMKGAQTLAGNVILNNLHTVGMKKKSIPMLFHIHKYVDFAASDCPLNALP